MPKMKTRRSAAKRYRVTGSGKVLRRQGFRSHIRRKKSSRRLRRLDGLVEVNGAQRRDVKRQLGL